MLLGEQPGDREDLAGAPFVGPSGRLLDQALGQAGLDRASIYVTNAVKHFKWVPVRKLRLHQKPNASEIEACRPWLELELALVKPRVVVALGATAAQALMGRDFRVTRSRGKRFCSRWRGQRRSWPRSTRRRSFGGRQRSARRFEGVSSGTSPKSPPFSRCEPPGRVANAPPQGCPRGTATGSLASPGLCLYRTRLGHSPTTAASTWRRGEASKILRLRSKFLLGPNARGPFLFRLSSNPVV